MKPLPRGNSILLALGHQRPPNQRERIGRSKETEIESDRQKY